eukprot:scaffold228731_cov33-Tisochrysis_lutea.AAC.3
MRCAFSSVPVALPQPNDPGAKTAAKTHRDAARHALLRGIVHTSVEDFIGRLNEGADNARGKNDDEGQATADNSRGQGCVGASVGATSGEADGAPCEAEGGRASLPYLQTREDGHNLVREDNEPSEHQRRKVALDDRGSRRRQPEQPLGDSAQPDIRHETRDRGDRCDGLGERNGDIPEAKEKDNADPCEHNDPARRRECAPVAVVRRSRGDHLSREDGAADFGVGQDSVRVHGGESGRAGAKE